MLAPTRSPSRAAPNGAITDSCSLLSLSAAGYTSVRMCSSPSLPSVKRTLLFIVTTSAGISSGGKISARSNSSFSASATGLLANAGCASSVSRRSASSSLMISVGLLITFSMVPFASPASCEWGAGRQKITPLRVSAGVSVICMCSLILGILKQK
ncbi:hypothetical protein SRABI106_03785 [Rahnella aquatilis]|nr:hypothetical protein SRABI106_03785 [Rahnella aquatilis]